jgi:hypothetical protein
MGNQLEARLANGHNNQRLTRHKTEMESLANGEPGAPATGNEGTLLDESHHGPTTRGAKGQQQ